MIKILNTESSMNLGGQELRILAEMEGLADRGYESVLAARPGSRILGEVEKRGLMNYPVKMRGSLDPAAVASFAHIILREKIDIVNAHGSKDGWSAGIAARLLGRKVIRSRHVANPIRAHFFGRLVYGPLCDVIVTTSESIKRVMAERGVSPGKIISIPTGVDTGRFTPDLEKGRLRAEVGVGDGVLLVGMVAVMRGDKGPDVFIRAAEIVASSLPDAVFVMAGDGWMLGKLEEMVSASPFRERIRLLGYRRDIPAILADLDVFCLPSLIPEGVPQAILQAHAMKCPVIASDIGGVNEVAIDGRTALCVPPGDADALARAIMKLIEDRALAGRLADEGYRLVQDGYALDGMLDRMDGVYRSLFGGR